MPTNEKLSARQEREALNAAGQSNADEAFERFIDGLVQLPPANLPDPNCSWCNWRRGDSPRNLRFCGFHNRLRNNMRQG
jgi:hypothetical protein